MRVKVNGEKLFNILTEKIMSQQELADKVGMKVQNINRLIHRDYKYNGSKTLGKIAQALKVPLTAFTDVIDKETKKEV